jgi:hypothetical protein
MRFLRPRVSVLARSPGTEAFDPIRSESRSPDDSPVAVVDSPETLQCFLKKLLEMEEGAVELGKIRPTPVPAARQV